MRNHPLRSANFSWYNAFPLILILLFTFVLRIPTLFEPWGGDQGVYGYIANGILEGKIPYKDMYTNTGYGLYFLYALLFKLFGNSTQYSLEQCR